MENETGKTATEINDNKGWGVKTPQERYYQDLKFKNFVDTLTMYIRQAEFTPSEVRMASILACINYEMMRTDRYVIVPEVEEALNTISSWYKDGD